MATPIHPQIPMAMLKKIISIAFVATLFAQRGLLRASIVWLALCASVVVAIVVIEGDSERAWVLSGLAICITDVVLAFVLIVARIRRREYFRAVFTFFGAVGVLIAVFFFVLMFAMVSASSGTSNLTDVQRDELGRDMFQHATGVALPSHAEIVYARLYGFPDAQRLVVVKSDDVKAIFDSIDKKGVEIGLKRLDGDRWGCGDLAQAPSEMSSALRSVCPDYESGKKIVHWYHLKPGVQDTEIYVSEEFLFLANGDF